MKTFIGGAMLISAAFAQSTGSIGGTVRTAAAENAALAPSDVDVIEYICEENERDRVHTPK